MIRRVIFSLLLVSYTLAAIDTTCKMDGEYCQNHWDCCSNTCLSFLYKCSHISIASDLGPVSQSFPAFSAFAPPLIPTQRPETMSFDSLISVIFPQSVQFQPIPVREVVKEIKPRVGNDEEEETLNTTSNWNSEEKIEEIITTTTTTTEGPQCEEIGSKCYRNIQCCSQRCHGYLHKCVT